MRIGWAGAFLRKTSVIFEIQCRSARVRTPLRKPRHVTRAQATLEGEWDNDVELDQGGHGCLGSAADRAGDRERRYRDAIRKAVPEAVVLQRRQQAFALQRDVPFGGLPLQLDRPLRRRPPRLGLGLVDDRFLPYITGGAAYSNLRATTTNTALAGASANRLGWTAGVGVEYAFLGNWTAKIEYLYADLGSFDCAGACVAGTTPNTISFREHIARAGINYKFSGPIFSRW